MVGVAWCLPSQRLTGPVGVSGSSLEEFELCRLDSEVEGGRRNSKTGRDLCLESLRRDAGLAGCWVVGSVQMRLHRVNHVSNELARPPGTTEDPGEEDA